MKIEYDMEFVSLKDFLELPFLNSYSKCTVYDVDNDNTLVDTISIKDLLIELEDGMYEEIQENCYVYDLMPDIELDDNSIYHGRYLIGLKRY